MSKFGPTGKFPRGKLLESDEGELKIGIGIIDRTIVIKFGEPTAWIGLDYYGAVGFAQTILKHAETIAPKKGRA